jgi:hypothetical protein
VIGSTVEGVAEADRFYGYFPMASHLVVQPQRVGDFGFTDGAVHRSALPPVYNGYTRTRTDPAYRPDQEDMQMLFRPLFLTSFFLDDFLVDNDFFGKVLSNTVLLALTLLLTVATIALFFQVDFTGSPVTMALVLGLGVIGFTALGTLFSGITAGTRMGGTLLPVLLFPLLVPLVAYGAAATSTLLAGFPASEVYGNLRMIVAFTLVALTAGMGLFRFIVEE